MNEIYPIERFNEKIMPITESGCWVWIGGLDSHGYGVFRANRKTHLAHRFSYEYFKEIIPEGLSIDHLCRVRCCVNPNHLEAVSQKENLKRGVGVKKLKEYWQKQTMCRKNLHELTPDNVVSDKKQNRCKACWKVSMKAAYKRRLVKLKEKRRKLREDRKAGRG